MNKYKINRLPYIEFDHEPTSDELMHFKYVKREKVNGKWRYYYTDSKTGESKDILGYDKRDDLLKADHEYKKATRQAELVNKTAPWRTPKLKSDGSGYEELSESDKRWNEETRTEIDNAYAKQAEAGKKASDAYAAYKKTPFGKVYQATVQIDKGRAAVGNLLEKAAKRLKTPRARV